MSFTLTITPAADDIDELGHVNNAVWVRWIQDVATAHWHAVASPAHLDAYVWVVSRHEIDYLGNVRAGEIVMARTWISDQPIGARFDRNMEFTNAAGKVIVRAKTTWVLIERATRKVRRVPPDVSQPFFS
jgi:acyl-CoA thioester hydrolase